MNENYLFDKTGEDAEIENLENLLQGFRRENTTAPKLPVKVVVFPTKTRRKTFKYAFAVAASLLLTFMLGLFALNFGKKTADNANLSNNVAPETISNAPETINQAPETVNNAPETISNAPETIKQARKTINDAPETIKQARKTINDAPETIKQARKTINNAPETINNTRKTINNAPEIVLTVQNINKFTVAKQKNVKKVPKISGETLTEDEKFAYEQLKLALSITGSKLKIVKEKIDNTENNISVVNKKAVTK
jgi:chromosome segregation ATPase